MATAEGGADEPHLATRETIAGLVVGGDAADEPHRAAREASPTMMPRDDAAVDPQLSSESSVVQGQGGETADALFAANGPFPSEPDGAARARDSFLEAIGGSDGFDIGDVLPGLGAATGRTRGADYSVKSREKKRVILGQRESAIALAREQIMGQYGQDSIRIDLDSLHERCATVEPDPAPHGVGQLSSTHDARRSRRSRARTSNDELRVLLEDALLQHCREILIVRKERAETLQAVADAVINKWNRKHQRNKFSYIDVGALPFLQSALATARAGPMPMEMPPTLETTLADRAGPMEMPVELPTPLTTASDPTAPAEWPGGVS
eukprot:m.245448 g.245448  ORF g.245448 m.245448 type:complete len:323 (+) comp14707_c0_seq1:300-1268(+)